MTRTKFYWHIHHEVLLEVRTEAISKRKNYIRVNKPQNEQKLRLKLLKPVRGKLPAKILKAGDARRKAWANHRKATAAYDKAIKVCEKRAAVGAAYYGTMAAYNKTWDAFEETWAPLRQALKANIPAIAKLHAKECPNCPWDGNTIFSALVTIKGDAT